MDKLINRIPGSLLSRTHVESLGLALKMLGALPGKLNHLVFSMYEATYLRSSL